MSDSVRPHQAPRPWDSPGKTLEWVAADERTAFKSQPSDLVNGRLTRFTYGRMEEEQKFIGLIS